MFLSTTKIFSLTIKCVGIMGIEKGSIMNKFSPKASLHFEHSCAKTPPHDDKLE